MFNLAFHNLDHAKATQLRLHSEARNDALVRAVRPSNSLSLLRFLAPRPSHRPSITA
jgi:hypothetical protein